MKEKVVFCLIASTLSTFVNAANQHETRYERYEDNSLSSVDEPLARQDSDFIKKYHDLSEVTYINPMNNSSIEDDVCLGSPCKSSSLSDISSIQGDTDSQDTETEFDVRKFAYDFLGIPASVQLPSLIIPYEAESIHFVQEIMTYYRSIDTDQMFHKLDLCISGLKKNGFSDSMIENVLNYRVYNFLHSDLSESIHTIKYIWENKLSVDNDILYDIFYSLFENPSRNNIFDFLQITKGLNMEFLINGTIYPITYLERLIPIKAQSFANVERPANCNLAFIFDLMAR